MEDFNVFEMMLFTLWIYLPGFLVNTFAMMWGKWLPKTGYGPCQSTEVDYTRMVTDYLETVRRGMV